MPTRLTLCIITLSLGCRRDAPTRPDVAIPITLVTISGDLPDASTTQVVLADPAPLAPPHPSPLSVAPRPAPCGNLDPSTGLLVPCFDCPNVNYQQRPSQTHSAPSARPHPQTRCGHTDPPTGLIIPCFP